MSFFDLMESFDCLSTITVLGMNHDHRVLGKTIWLRQFQKHPICIMKTTRLYKHTNGWIPNVSIALKSYFNELAKELFAHWYRCKIQQDAKALVNECEVSWIPSSYISLNKFKLLEAKPFCWKPDITEDQETEFRYGICSNKYHASSTLESWHNAVIIAVQLTTSLHDHNE